MKLTVATSELQKALAYVLPVITKTVADPVYLHVQMEASGSVLKLRATDTIITVSTRVAAKVQEDGALGVNAERLHKIISNVSAESVSMTLKGPRLEVKAKRSKSNLAHIDADKFPNWPVPLGPGAKVDADALARCLKWTKHSMLEDANRPALSGVRIESEERSYLIASACDSRRLSRAGALVEDMGQDLMMFVPTRAARVLLKFCEWSKGQTINVLAASREAFFWNDEGLGYNCKLLTVSGVKPESARPKTSPRSLVRFNRVQMVEAVTRLRAIEDREIKFTLREKSIVLVVENSKGSGEEEVPAGVSGDLIEMKISGDYLQEALASMKTVDVFLYLWSFREPMMLVPEDDEDLFELIMPMGD